MNLSIAFDCLGAHYRHARAMHPEPKDRVAWNRLLMARITDLDMAAADTTQPDAKLVAGKRALETATMALRAIEDLNLGIVGPAYDSGDLPHTQL